MHETFIFLLPLFPASDELDTAEEQLVTFPRSVIISLLPKTPRHYRSPKLFFTINKTGHSAKPNNP